jgi:hypothetical protein
LPILPITLQRHPCPLGRQNYCNKDRYGSGSKGQDLGGTKFFQDFTFFWVREEIRCSRRRDCIKRRRSLRIMGSTVTPTCPYSEMISRLFDPYGFPTIPKKSTSDHDQFHYHRATFSSQVKSKVDRVTLNSSETVFVVTNQSGQDVVYLRSFLLRGFGYTQRGPTTVWEDYASCIMMSENPTNGDRLMSKFISDMLMSKFISYPDQHLRIIESLL